MNSKKISEQIEYSFRSVVRNDNKVRNAYLLVYSEKLGIDINIAEGKPVKYPPTQNRRTIWHQSVSCLQQHSSEFFTIKVCLILKIKFHGIWMLI